MIEIIFDGDVTESDFLRNMTVNSTFTMTLIEVKRFNRRQGNCFFWFIWVEVGDFFSCWWCKLTNSEVREIVRDVHETRCSHCNDTILWISAFTNSSDNVVFKCKVWALSTKNVMARLKRKFRMCRIRFRRQRRYFTRAVIHTHPLSTGQYYFHFINRKLHRWLCRSHLTTTRLFEPRGPWVCVFYCHIVDYMKVRHSVIIFLIFTSKP